MKVLVAGGLYSRTAGFDNAVCQLTDCISRIHEVYVVDISAFPFPRRKWSSETSRLVHPRLRTLRYLASSVFSGDALRDILRYMKTASLMNPIWLVRYVINYSRFRAIVREVKPDIVHIHSCDIERSAFFHAVLRERLPTIATIHGLYSLDHHIICAYRCAELEQDLLEDFINSGNHVVFVSSGLMNETVAAFNLSPQRLHVVRNGVDSTRFQPQPPSTRARVREKYGISASSAVIIQVGTLYRLKNHVAVLEALSCIPDDDRKSLHYIIVGDGPERCHLEELARSYGISECCTFTGQANGSALVELYSASDYLVVPSTTEAFPLVTLEAMAMGLPVIIYDDLWPVTDLQDSNGLMLIRGRNREAVARAIECAMTQEWDRNGIIQFARNASWKSIALDYNEIYELVFGELTGSFRRHILTAHQGLSSERRDAA